MLQKIREDDDKNLLEKGFTLVELLIVVVILGILAGIVVFAVGNLTDDAQNNACATEKRTLETAVEAYRVKYGEIPAETGADSLLQPPNGDPALIKSESANFDIEADGTVTADADGDCA